ncbi:MAG: HXXEE domain-containing protein [Deltaproteobacteria bacterium HGW-Deltaproteobacteria-6]|jgi:hypothetical protein|nr:MAG: HXXEE domain-containing protein [Deltaproteobacteria bacterium HGW-Deltaproteobacteria-6]
MFELLFLLSFTLHNLEEAFWLPDWSKYAKKFHPAVEKTEFHFAVLMITIIGYLITFAYLVMGETSEIVKYIYLGFVLMMSLNAIFPHLIASIVLRRYAPGTMTGCLLNLPIGLYIVFIKNQEHITNIKLLFSFILTTVIIVSLLKPLFFIGKKIMKE